MDRVLLVFDDLQFSGHVEMTLRKVGFDTETITNEYNLSDKLLTFNPNYIIVKGSSPRVSVLQVGKKLTESVKYSGKVVLIFQHDSKPKPEELIKLRMDLLLLEPISALRLVAHLLTLTDGNRESIMDKLLRIAHTDPQFRQNEQHYIKNSGASIDAEIQLISSGLKSKADPGFQLDENSIQSFVDPNFKPAPEAPQTGASGEASKKQSILEPISTRPADEASQIDGTFDIEMDPEYTKNLASEIEAVAAELPLRIETYNRAIKGIDQDLKKGHSKRHTKQSAKNKMAESSDQFKKQIDDERKNFASALWKKDKGE